MLKLALLGLALGKLPLLISAQPFAFVRAGFPTPSLPSPSAVVQPELQKVLLVPAASAQPRATNLTTSSHKCSWAESDLKN